MSFGPLISTEALAALLGADDLTVLDCSWYLPDAKRDPKAEYGAAHIPGALFYDLDAMSDPATPLPHMLAAPDMFAAAMGALGAGSKDRIVVYDGAGIFSAPRVWWTLRAMGHDLVAVLDGGLPKWRKEGRPLESGFAARAPRDFRAAPRAGLVRDLAQMKAAVAQGTASILDARPAARFTGAQPEPRPGLRAGHMPGAVNIPSSTLTNPDGTLRGADALRALIERSGADPSKPPVTTCGSGVTASTLALALAVIGYKDVPVYDGSWAEWGARSDTPVATG